MPKNSSGVFAPKGLLRMLILRIASIRPVTGVEIMQEVPNMTERLWTPSPGSVYFLLGEMEKSGLLLRVPTGEPGIKRYVSSEKGKLNLANFKIDAKKNLYRQLILSRVLSDLAESGSVSEEITAIAKKMSIA